MKRSNSNISLAGWLFADLALVLFVIFLPSTITDEDISAESSTTSTTTTIDSETSTNRGVIPEPIEITVSLQGNNPTRDALLRAIQAGLAKKNIPREVEFGVIYVLTGIQEDTVDGRRRATSRALFIAEELKAVAREGNAESDQLKSWLYVLHGHSSGIRYPEVSLKMFPDND